MQEAVKSQWSTRQLERQINSFFYERLLSSKNKEQVAAKIQTLEPVKKPEDVIRVPYVLEFLGLAPNIANIFVIMWGYDLSWILISSILFSRNKGYVFLLI